MVCFESGSKLTGGYLEKHGSDGVPGGGGALQGGGLCKGGGGGTRYSLIVVPVPDNGRKECPIDRSL